MIETDREEETEETEDEETEAPYLKARFHIDTEWIAAQGRSLKLLLLHRRCASCWGGLVQEPNGGQDIAAAEHMKRIAQHCSKTPDFIHPEMPLMEAIFRLLLANRNRPLNTEEIYEKLRERWVDPVNPRIPSEVGIYRLLSSDTFYGIRELNP